MAPFKINIVVQVFLISIIFNIAHAGYSEDVEECIRQLGFAFGYYNAASSCLKYAIQFYTEGQSIKIPEKYESKSNQSKHGMKQIFHYLRAISSILVCKLYMRKKQEQETKKIHILILLLFITEVVCSSY